MQFYLNSRIAYPCNECELIYVILSGLRRVLRKDTACDANLPPLSLTLFNVNLRMSEYLHPLFYVGFSQSSMP